MSFLSTFIELSLLDEAEEQNARLSNNSYLLKRQNDLIQQQNEGINALLAHNQQQDWIRDYIYRVNKLCDKLQTYADKTSIQYYYSIYCLAKCVNDSGITTSVISELKDKEYFDKCLEKIGHLIFDFSNNNREKLAEFNKHIQNIEEAPFFTTLKSFEDARYRIHKIKESVKNYEKSSKISKLGFLFSFTPFTILLILYFKNVHNHFYIPVWVIIFIWFMLSIITGAIISEKWKNKLYPDDKEKLQPTEYQKLIKEKEECEKKLTQSKECYEFAKQIYPNFDFDDENEVMLDLIHNAFENKALEIIKSLEAFNNSATTIYETFYLKE